VVVVVVVAPQTLLQETQEVVHTIQPQAAEVVVE
jgi:hypothetical protein